MNSFPATSLSFLPRLPLLLSLFWVCGVLLMPAAGAVAVTDLYEVSMPVTSNRDAAFVDALRVVAVRVSGRRDAAARLGGTPGNPRQYVQRFSFTPDNVLLVAFDSVSVDKLLIDAGLPIWARERPATLVLLNVTAANGSNYWIDSAGMSAEREMVTRAAKQRGLPIIWPDMSTIDRTQLHTGDDAATADPGALMQAASRYNANAALLGNARSDGAGGLAVRWQLASDSENVSASGSLEDGVHMAADAFARVYSASGASLDSVAVEVSGINTLGAYADTLNYLEAMTLVRAVAVEQVSGDTMKFKLAVRGDAATLRRALALDGKLVAVSQADASQPVDRLQFRYQP
ncbi:MAG TPA: DUF2066 domain-containing protein [Povalibacter sp.]